MYSYYCLCDTTAVNKTATRKLGKPKNSLHPYSLSLCIDTFRIQYLIFQVAIMYAYAYIHKYAHVDTSVC